MKRINLLKSFLVMSIGLPILVGCNKTPQPIVPPEPPKTEEQLVNEKSSEALGMASVSYAAFSQSQGISKDADLMDNVNIDGYNYYISYSVVAKVEGYLEDYAKIVKDSEKGQVLKITVPEDSALPADNQKYAGYVLKGETKFRGYDDGLEAPEGVTFTKKCVDKKYASGEWNVRINSAKTFNASIEGIYDAIENKTIKSGTRVITRGVYAGLSGGVYESSGIVFVDDGEYSLALFNSQKNWSSSECTTLNIGDKIEITGILDIYYGLVELKQYTVALAPDADVTPGVKAMVTAIPEDDSRLGARYAEMTGTLVSLVFSYGETWLYGTVKCNVNINLTGAKDSEGKLLVEACAYVHYRDSQERYDSWKDLSDANVGSTITFEGRYEWYEGLPELYYPLLTSVTPAA